VIEKSSDPIAVWQKMVGEMQKSFSSLAKPMSPSGTSLAAPQRQFGDFMETYLVSMNMPSRAQMVGISEQLHGIEGQLSEIKALLVQLQAAPAPPAPDSAGAPKPRAKRVSSPEK
jgi:hypothetical protein